jgi:hypothetical protein
MTDWRQITSKEFDDGLGYEVFHDDTYDGDWYERGFKIYATEGSKKYIPVDVCINAKDADEANHIEQLLKDSEAHLPLYLYAHSGVSVSTVPFGDPFDSGQCGFAVLEKEQGVSWGPEAVQTLELMVKEFDNVLRGNVIGWKVTKRETCDKCNNSNVHVIDSMGGYIGYDFKDLDSLIVNDIMPIIEHERSKMKEAEHASTATAIGND